MRYIVLAVMACVLSLGWVMVSPSSVSSKIAAQVQGEELQWYGFNEGLKLAKEQNKFVMVDIYTDWCGWCKKLDKTTYQDAKVVEALKKDFISVKFNPEKDGSYEYTGKTYTGKQLETKFKVDGYPMILFLDSKEGVVKKIDGYVDATEMSGILAKITKK